MNSAAGVALNVLGTRSPAWIPIVHDGLEMRNVFQHERCNCSERATHNTILSISGGRRVGMPLGNGKASVLNEQAWLAKYITTHEDEATVVVSYCR